MKKKTYTCVLTIAGSDSIGGAGIQADLKTFSALGCYGASVITAVTAQNTTAVTGIHALPPEFVQQQIEAVFSDITVDAVKIGMLANDAITEAVAQQLSVRKVKNIVVDPVMVSTSGAELLRSNAIDLLKEKFFPLSTIVTPNIPEAEALTGLPIKNKSDMENAATTILSLGANAVLLKGGHLEGPKCSDCLCLSDTQGKPKMIWLESKKIDTKNTHGTGCTLSSAIAAYLGKGYSLERAVKEAHAYVLAAIRSGAQYKLGKGYGPVHHFYKYWK